MTIMTVSRSKTHTHTTHTHTNTSHQFMAHPATRGICGFLPPSLALQAP